MTTAEIIILTISIITFIYFIFSKKSKSYIKSMLIGIIVFCMLNASSVILSFGIPFTAVNIVSSACLGIPGVILSLVMDIIA